MAKMHIPKLQTLKDSVFQTDSLKTQENRRDGRTYAIILCLIGLALSFFYYSYLQYYGGSYFAHYYEYYTRAVVIADALTKSDFPSVLGHYFNSYADKILIWRIIPFFLLFGPSHFIFFYSNVLFNLFLMIILFHSLLKIMQPEKAFSLTLFILSQYFFLELLASFYVDLSFFLVCSIFFIYLSSFDRHPEKYNIRLAFIVFLMFLIKNVSYPLLALVSILCIIYFFIAKKERMPYILRFVIIVSTGFLMYYLLVLKCSRRILISDLHAAMSTAPLLGEKKTLISAACEIFRHLGIFKNFSFLGKFPFPPFNIAVYPIALFVAYKKREVFWIFLFFVADFFFLFFYNIKGHHHDYRYFLPFYFVYLYFAYEFMLVLLNRILPKRRVPGLLVLSFAILFLTSMVRLLDPGRRMAYAGNYYCVDFFSEHLPARSKVHIVMADIPEYFHFYGSFIDRHNKDFSYLAKVDPRFKYKIVDSLEKADYAIGKSRVKLSHKESELVTTMGEYRLFKIK